MSKKNLPVLDRIVKKEGCMTQGFIDVAQKPDSSWVSLPVVIIEGKEEGPVFLADACNHGDEYEGTEAIIRFLKEYKNGNLKGTFIGVLAVNFDAFVSNTRSSPIDFQNMNRIYPGNPDLYISNRVAHTYFEKVLKKADYFISFHGGGVALHLDPVIGYQGGNDATAQTSRKMAEAFGARLLWRMQNLPFSGASSVEAEKIGIPGIVPEVGSHCGRLYDWEKNVEIQFQGLKNVMKSLGLISGQLKPAENQMNIELNYLHTSVGGMHNLLKRPMEMVKEGETLATITDIFGNWVGEVKAPFDAIIIGFYSVPVINPGDWSYLIGKVLS